MIRAVLFDLDGTLCDTQSYILHAYNNALQAKGLAKISSPVIAKYAGLPLRGIYPLLAPGCNPAEMIALHRDYQLSHMNDVKPYPQLKQTLAALQARGLALAIVTGRYRSTAGKILDLLGISGFFKVVITGDDKSEGKPHPGPYIKAAHLLHVKPSECLVVGDGASDMESGRKAGCIVARAVYGYGASEPTQHKPDFELRKLSEVLGLVGK